MLVFNSISSPVAGSSVIYLVTSEFDPQSLLKEAFELKQYQSQLDAKSDLITVIGVSQTSYFVKPIEKKQAYQLKEHYRKKGATLADALNKEKQISVTIENLADSKEVAYELLEGLALANYQFLKYKSAKNVNALAAVNVVKGDEAKLKELSFLLEAVYATRDLVNEPVVSLTAEIFSEEMVKLGKDAGFTVEVLDKKQIESLKMGGLLAINIGAPNPPTFNILEYKPANVKNSQPIVLVGKGVVYDTGGLSLKDTPNSMDLMKCDMAGGAAVVGAFVAIAKNKLPVHVVGLIPATENRPDGNAITPGDVITMFDGKTVEILNTDAEGRVILADALAYAKKYNPSLVIDLATLTGAAIMALGSEAAVMMGTAEEDVKSDLKKSGFEVYERLVELPLWEEYDKHTESDIADLKNVGNGPQAGAISAGKFMEKFTDYPWIHLDIAGPAFIKTPDSYRGKNATGMGVRLLYNFLKNV